MIYGNTNNLLELYDADVMHKEAEFYSLTVMSDDGHDLFARDQHTQPGQHPRRRRRRRPGNSLYNFLRSLLKVFY